MRVLGIGDDVSLGDLYHRLWRAGHDVRVHAEDAIARQDVMAGVLHLVDDWRTELPWIRDAGDDGMIVFETAHHGALQQELRRDGYRVIGGSPLGDRLESDRVYAQDVARAVMDVRIAPSHRFADFDSAIAFVRRTPARYVYKMNGSGFASTRNYVGAESDGCDVIAWLTVQRDRWSHDDAPDFVLMEHVSGVEIGVGAYFNGHAFLTPACLDWEHKRFFPGDVGELTGEMGTLVTYRGSDRLFDETLSRLAPMLEADGYVGYINLNTIVNDAGIWPLEFTCRFGYPGFAVLDALQCDGWESILTAMAGGVTTTLATHDGYAVGVVLTVPPFPYRDGYDRLSKGLPITVRAGMTPDDEAAIHWGEVARVDGQLVTAGEIGYIAVVTGRGSTAESARDAVYARVPQVVIPNVRYRADIGERFIAKDRATLERLGILPAPRRAAPACATAVLGAPVLGTPTTAAP